MSLKITVKRANLHVITNIATIENKTCMCIRYAWQLQKCMYDRVRIKKKQPTKKKEKSTGTQAGHACIHVATCTCSTSHIVQAWSSTPWFKEVLCRHRARLILPWLYHGAVSSSMVIPRSYYNNSLVIHTHITRT